MAGRKVMQNIFAWLLHLGLDLERLAYIRWAK